MVSAIACLTTKSCKFVVTVLLVESDALGAAWRRGAEAAAETRFRHRDSRCRWPPVLRLAFCGGGCTNNGTDGAGTTANASSGPVTGGGPASAGRPDGAGADAADAALEVRRCFGCGGALGRGFGATTRAGRPLGAMWAELEYSGRVLGQHYIHPRDLFKSRELQSQWARAAATDIETAKTDCSSNCHCR